MEDEYDFVILGTGLQQCMLADTISKRGLRVLQIDKNKTYGSDLRTLNYLDLCEKCSTAFDPALKEINKKFNIDITPKFLLADGLMKDYLVKHDIQNLVSFIDIPGHFVFRKNNLHAIPHNEKASLTSGLISLMQKPKVAKFFWSVRKYSENKEKVLSELKECSEPHKNADPAKTLKIVDNLTGAFQFNTSNMQREFEHFGLSKESIDLIGHAIALNLDDHYLSRHPSYTYDKIYFYIKSLVSLNGIRTPFIYPLFGISELCQAFSRRAGMSGCVFMLNTPVLQIKYTTGESIEANSTPFDQCMQNSSILKDVNQKDKIALDLNDTEQDSSISNTADLIHRLDIKSSVEGSEPHKVTIQDAASKSHKYLMRIYDSVNKVERSIFTNKIISETSYFPTKTKVAKQIITGIFIIRGNIPLIHKKYRDTQSAHILFLAKEIGRNNDIFMAVLGEREQSTPENYCACIINTIKETQQEPIDEINMCLALLGDIVAQFVWVRDMRTPTFRDRDIIMINDVDETTHLESLYDDYIRCERETTL